MAISHEMLGPNPSNLEINKWLEFEAKILDFPSQVKSDIEAAYKSAEKGHRGQFRVNGDRFFDHPRAVALILIDEVGIRNPEILILALLHDTWEDTALWATPLGSGQVDEFEKISQSFNRKIAYELHDLTINEEVFGKAEAEEIYYQALSRTSSEVLLVKMADRLHNLQTLSIMPCEKRFKKLKETSRLIPICERASNDYPQETGILMELINTAITEAEQDLPENTRKDLAKSRRRYDKKESINKGLFWI